MAKIEVFVIKPAFGWPTTMAWGEVQTSIGKVWSPTIVFIPEIETIKVGFGYVGTEITYIMGFTPDDKPMFSTNLDEPQIAEPHQINAALAVIRYFDRGLEENIFDFSNYNHVDMYSPGEAKNITEGLVEKAKEITLDSYSITI